MTGATKPGRTRTRLDPVVRREQIVDAAEAVFAGRDPAEVTFEELAEAAGVSRALVYNYFGDKGGVIAAIYLRSSRRLDEELLRTVDSAGSAAEDRLRAIIEVYLRFASDNAAAWKLIGTAEATVHPQVQRARRERYEQMAASWGGTPGARVVARGLVGFLEAATLEWLESGDVDIDHAVRIFHSTLWRGLSGLEPPLSRFGAAEVR